MCHIVLLTSDTLNESDDEIKINLKIANKIELFTEEFKIFFSKYVNSSNISGIIYYNLNL